MRDAPIPGGGPASPGTAGSRKRKTGGESVRQGSLFSEGSAVSGHGKEVAKGARETVLEGDRFGGVPGPVAKIKHEEKTADCPFSPKIRRILQSGEGGLRIEKTLPTAVS